MSEEQAIYGLIVTAQEQQKIASEQLATMDELKTTIRHAGEALQDVLERVSDKASASIVEAIKLAVSALQAVSGDAVGAGQTLRDSISWVNWKWLVVCVAAELGLFSAVMLGVLLIPSARDLTTLRAEKGGTTWNT